MLITYPLHESPGYRLGRAADLDQLELERRASAVDGKNPQSLDRRVRDFATCAQASASHIPMSKPTHPATIPVFWMVARTRSPCRPPERGPTSPFFRGSSVAR